MIADISLPFGLSFRAVQVHDQEFLEKVFSSTREHLNLIPLPKSQIDFLIRQQFLMQQSSYSAAFPSAETFIIEHHSIPVGKITLNNTKESIHIIDIALISSMRGVGVGSALLRAIKEAAARQLCPLHLAVDSQNFRAKKLYLELGFVLVESSATHDMLSWN